MPEIEANDLSELLANLRAVETNWPAITSDSMPATVLSTPTVSDGACTCDTCKGSNPAMKILGGVRGMGTVLEFNTDVLEVCTNRRKPLFGRVPKDLTKEPYLGIELELGTEDYTTLCSSLHDVHSDFLLRQEQSNKYTRNCITKSDSSIEGYGYELVTVPATLRYHKKLWKSFFKNSVKYFKTNDSMGMHVHISRDFFTPLSLSKFVIFINATANQPFISKIAGRSREICESYSTYKEAGWDASFTHGLAKYQAVNLLKQNTVELRIFASTLDRQEFLARLEFTHAAVHFVKRVGNRELTTLKFSNYVKNRRKRYPNLFKLISAMAIIDKKLFNGDYKVTKSPVSKVTDKYLTMYPDRLEPSWPDFIRQTKSIREATSNLLNNMINRYGSTEHVVYPKGWRRIALKQIDLFITLIEGQYRHKGRFVTWDTYLMYCFEEGIDNIKIGNLYKWLDLFIRRCVKDRSKLPYNMFITLDNLATRMNNRTKIRWDDAAEEYVSNSRPYKPIGRDGTKQLLVDLKKVKELIKCA